MWDTEHFGKLEMLWGFPGDSDGEESTCNAGDPGSIPGSGRSSGVDRLSTPVFFPGEFHSQTSPAGYSPWGQEESDMIEQLTHREMFYFLILVTLSKYIFIFKGIFFK